MHFPIIHLEPKDEQELKNKGVITFLDNLNSNLYNLENIYRLYSESESLLGIASYSKKLKKWVLDRAFW